MIRKESSVNSRTVEDYRLLHYFLQLEREVNTGEWEQRKMADPMKREGMPAEHKMKARSQAVARVLWV